jgi:eukaryotic-like serine/threonine-protein kinase
MNRHDRLTELFTAAIELPAGDRAALVDGVRAGDRELADELVAMLAADAVAPTALRTGALAPMLAPTPSEAALRPPPEIEGYHVVGVLGTGGMGTVYAAEQDAPRRSVAIKLLHARASAALVRFWAEADILARLDHPGIVRVLAAGRVDDRPYLVMERVDGTTLDRHLRADAPLARRLAVFAAICDAVHHAHVHGVIHRDLKPSNVMVRGDGRITVLDFGVARATADDGTASGTRAGELIGTPLYMSPEQARLRPDEVDVRSDVYSLGVMLYELCSGALPYDVAGAALPEVTRAICHDPPRPLGRRDPALRGDLEAIAAKALAKAPAERYQSAAALADDVRAVVERRPVTARNPGALEHVQRFVRRRPWTAAAIAGAVVAVAAFAIVATALWRGAERARLALEQRSNQLVLRQARAALARDPTEALAWLGTLTPRGVDPETAWAIADEALGRGVARHVVRAHASDAHRIAPLADGTGFVTAGYDGRVVRWGEPPGAGRVVFATDRDVSIAAAAPSGAPIAIAADDGLLAMVDGAGAELARPTVHSGDVQRLAWTPDGAWLVTADDRGGVWRWPRGVPPGVQLVGPTAEVTTLAVGEDGAAIIVGDAAGAVWVWPRADAPGAALPGTGTAQVVGGWTDGARVVAIDDAGTVREWRLGDPAPLRAVATGIVCKRAEVAPGGGWELLAGRGGAVTRVEGDAIETVAVHRDSVRTIAISGDGRWIASGADDGSLHLVDRRAGRGIELRGHRERIRHVAFARRGAVLLSSDGAGVVRIWSLDDAGAGLAAATGALIEHVARSPDGGRLAAVDAAGAVIVWDLTTGAVEHRGRIDGHPRAVGFAGAAVVAATLEGTVAWLAPDGTAVRHDVGGRINMIAIAPDDAELAVATADGVIARFSAVGMPLAALAGGGGGSDAVAYAADGRLIASGGEDRAIRVWRRDPGGAAPVLIAALDGPTSDTHVVGFAPRGDYVIAGSDDGGVRAWAIAGGAIDPASRRVLVEHVGAVTALGFAPDDERGGTAVVSAARDGSLARVVLATGAATMTQLDASAITILASADGTVRALTIRGSVERWDGTSARPVRTIEAGVHAAIALDVDGTRGALALADGAIAFTPLAPRSLDALFTMIRARDLPVPAAR